MKSSPRLHCAVPEDAAAIFRAHGVANWWLFGSRASRSAAPDSDWDFLVEFRSPPTFNEFMDLKLSLEAALGAPVDILSLSACKPRFLEAIGATATHAP